jgi:hypothetical protein
MAQHAVTKYVRPIYSEEYEVLRSALGFFSANKAESEGNVEVLQMKADTVYYLNPCGPGCCPPQLLFQIGMGEFLYIAGKTYSHGLELFADKEENLNPFFKILWWFALRKVTFLFNYLEQENHCR